MRKKEKQEWLRLAESESLRKDMRRVSESRHNPFLKNGEIDIDSYIEFLDTYNAFINHQRKPFKPMMDRMIKL